MHWPRSGTVHSFGAPHVVGRDEVLASWQDLFDRVDDVDVTFTEPRVHVDGNVVWVTGQEIAEVREGGGEPFTVSLAVTKIFEKIDGNWQLVLHHVTELTNTSKDADAG